MSKESCPYDLQGGMGQGPKNPWSGNSSGGDDWGSMLQGFDPEKGQLNYSGWNPTKGNLGQVQKAQQNPWTSALGQGSNQNAWGKNNNWNQPNTWGQPVHQANPLMRFNGGVGWGGSLSSWNNPATQVVGSPFTSSFTGGYDTTNLMNQCQVDQANCAGYGYKCMQWYDGDGGGGNIQQPDQGCLGYGYKCMQWYHGDGENKYGCEWDKTNCGAGYMNGNDTDPGCLGYGYKCMQWYHGDGRECPENAGCTQNVECPGDGCSLYGNSRCPTDVAPAETWAEMLHRSQWDPYLGIPQGTGLGTYDKEKRHQLNDRLSM